MESFLTSLPVAHRGLHDKTRPENSLSAFAAAISCGYAIETDVRFTADKQLVVFHDDTLLRMTGDSRAVSDCTLEEIKALTIAGTNERIPTFAEFLRFIDGKVPLLIEIKSMADIKGEEIAAAVARETDGYGGEYAVQSFQPFYVKAYKQLRPEIPCGLLSSARMTKADLGAFWRIKRYLLANLKLNFTVKPDFISYCFADLPRRAVTKFRGPKLAWTVRCSKDEAAARRYTDNVIFENYCPKK